MVAGKSKKYLGLFAGVSAGFKWNGPGQPGPSSGWTFETFVPFPRKERLKKNPRRLDGDPV